MEEGTKELFDLDADPGEGSNLYSKLPKKAAALASQLESWRQSHTPAGLVQVPVSDEDKQRLRNRKLVALPDRGALFQEGARSLGRVGGCA